jgi:bifunctional DNase/RNase
MSLIRLDITGISYSQTQNGAYALILSEQEGERQLPIVIGAAEAQSIAIALEEEIQPPRPLTHDLMKNLAEDYAIKVRQIIIHKLIDGVFYSSLICEREGVEKIIDARTSDAIALALRFDAPIFTYKNILEKAGVYLASEEKSRKADQSDEAKTQKSKPKANTQYSKMKINQLNDLLDKAVKNEDYEKAAKLRDEISKRS